MNLEFLRSPLLERIAGVAHAFTTRTGGVSDASFTSFNLSSRVGDVQDSVNANRARLLDALGRPRAAFVVPKQVHGASVFEVTRDASRVIEADGMWTRDRHVAVGVLIADCVPILMASSDGTAVAAVHAGWRGTQARIAARAVERMVAGGFAANSLVVALGPAIGPCCFEIDAATYDELAQAYPECGSALRMDAQGRRVADLWALNEQALIAAGIAPANIDRLDHCTSCQTARFFSHRRDNGQTGRQAAVIAPLLR